jgi:hypothetical protein
MKHIKRAFGACLMIVGLGLCTLYFYSADRKTVARQAEDGGVAATSPAAKSKGYLFAGFAIAFIGANLVRRN